MPRQSALTELPGHIESVAAAGVDALIIADPGLLRLARRYAPGLEVHLSTQANTCNGESAAFWQDQGVCRVNLARELSCRDIHAIRKACPNLELEVFVHGAMCLAVSGKCLLSAWLNDRPANEGRCTQPCRFAYRQVDKVGKAHGLDKTGAAPCSQAKNATDNTPCSSQTEVMVEEYTRQGEPMWRVREHGQFSSLWAPDDLCLFPYLAWFVQNGVHALKIEGRMRSAAYVAHVVDAYATALAALKSPSSGPFSPQKYMAELFNTAVRPMGTGFFLHNRRRVFEAASDTFAFTLRPILARVAEPQNAGAGAWVIDVRANWDANRPVELMLPGLNRPALPAHSYRLENHRGEAADAVGCGTRCTLYAEHPGIMPGIFIRAAGM